jgi:hypothetical protein
VRSGVGQWPHIRPSQANENPHTGQRVEGAALIGMNQSRETVSSDFSSPRPYPIQKPMRIGLHRHEDAALPDPTQAVVHSPGTNHSFLRLASPETSYSHEQLLAYPATAGVNGV